jgi:hypothetical protein
MPTNDYRPDYQVGPVDRAITRLRDCGIDASPYIVKLRQIFELAGEMRNRAIMGNLSDAGRDDLGWVVARGVRDVIDGGD